MDRGPFSDRLSWLLLPVAAVLVASALGVPRQSYTGLLLRENWVAAVEPGSPGERAGIKAGDRLLPAPPAEPSSFRGPFADARSGAPVAFLRVRGGERRTAWLIPEPLPDGERRMLAALLAVASGFVLLGGWVWSERRDRLTRPFFLLSLAFAWLLAPMPKLPGLWAGAGYELFYGAITLFLPALLIHFFALFPEPRAPRGRLAAGVMAGYGTASLLFAALVAAFALRMLKVAASVPTLAMVQAAATLWFAAGLVSALVLFVRSYRRAGSSDARRRLRVALAGTVLGLGPLAALIALRNLAPSVTVPGERWMVMLTLLVPASFAWSTVVHRIFDFRVALRATAFAVVVALVGAALIVAGEWTATAWGPEAGSPITSMALALVGLGASIAGPLRPWLRSVEDRLVAPGFHAALEEAGRETTARHRPASEILGEACSVLRTEFKLDRCTAVEMAGSSVRLSARAGLPIPSLDLGPRFASVLSERPGLRAADDSAFAAEDREELEMAGFHWVLPVGGVGAGATFAALLLGRRLTGTWLDQREIAELGRLAGRLGIALENLQLRRAAASHGAIDREIEQAGAIQAHLLPRRAPVYPTLDCAAATLSSEAVGGDYYDFVQRSDREFTLVVGDAAGKGVPAALLLAGVQARFRSEAARGRDPGQVLGVLNQDLVDLDQPEKFVGLLCARVDVRRGQVRIANAGLSPPLVRRREGGCEEITPGGILLGVSAAARYPDARFQLRAGDVALVYTDGLTEARRNEELFGTERVRDLVERNAHRRAARILEALLDSVREFADQPLDDLTVLVLKQLADPMPEPRTGPRAGLKWKLASVDTPG